MFPTFGTLVNASLVLFGGLIGFRFSNLIPDRYRVVVLQAIGMFTIMTSVRLMSEYRPELPRVFLFLLLGAVLGNLLGLEEKLDRLTQKASNLSKGFVSASLLFTVGPMTLMGCILEGTKGDSSLLLSKAVMDGLSSVILSSSLGLGVALSSLYVLLFQGSITLLAYFFGDFLSPQAMSNALFIGSGLMLLIGVKLLGLLENLRVLNLMPALFLSLFF